MRFMMLVKASKDSEAGAIPDDRLIAAMAKYNEEMAKAESCWIWQACNPARGRAHQILRRKAHVIEGPFPETKDLIAGYWLIQVNSKEEAIDWAKHCPSPHGEAAEGEIELRQVFELEDFGPSPAIEDARRLEGELAKKK